MILLTGVLSVVSYAAVSAIINGQPSTSPFQGWIALLQPPAGLAGDEVQLEVDALVPGAPGQHPALAYTVTACGGQPFRGMLLIGGDARLAGLHGRPALGTSNPQRRSSVEKLRSLRILDEPTGTVLNLGPVQAIQLVLNRTGPCASVYAPHQVPPPQFMGQFQTVTGRAAAPVQRQWRLGWWAGPRTSQVWPLVGTFPTVNVNEVGPFQALGGLSGSWDRPIRPYFAIHAGGLHARAALDEVRPQPVSSTGLDWESSQPLQATAVVTDNNSLSAWQDWLVGAAIFLGIGGSLLANLLFEWARPPSVRSRPEQQPAPATGKFVTLMLLVILAWIIRASRRRNQAGETGTQ